MDLRVELNSTADLLSNLTGQVRSCASSRDDLEEELRTASREGEDCRERSGELGGERDQLSGRLDACLASLNDSSSEEIPCNVTQHPLLPGDGGIGEDPEGASLGDAAQSRPSLADAVTSRTTLERRLRRCRESRADNSRRAHGGREATGSVLLPNYYILIFLFCNVATAFISFTLGACLKKCF